jgi:hypothetical protein
MPTSWTVDQILALAPDPGSVKAGKEQASLRKWTSLGQHERLAWGLCQGSAKEPYQTLIDLSEPAFNCSCTSRKFPCKHALGLFLLLAAQPGSFREMQPPAWGIEWLAARQRKAAKRVQPKEKTSKPPDPVALAKNTAQREAKVAGGVKDLRLWLEDMVRHGLAAAQGQPLRFWETPAARLVDAQAPGLARMVREMASIPPSGEGWQGRLLEHAARLYLLLESYKRLDHLSADIQASLLSLIGWTQSQQKLLEQEGESDLWLVLGQRVEEELLGGSSRTAGRVQWTWLWGQHLQKAALILHFAPPGQPVDTSLVPGTALEAELVFYPGAYPLRALVKARRSPPSRFNDLNTYATIHKGAAHHAAALAANPWLDVFPMVLNKVIPMPINDTWVLCDSEGRYLPVTRRFQLGWQLYAISGGYGLTCFGEWDGSNYLPLSCSAGERWITLA